MRASKRGVRLAWVGLIAAVPLGAWQDAETPVFRTGTLLVQVDVVVRDGDKAVRGLTKDDFQVFDNGKRQEIAVFALRETKVEPQPASPATVKGPQYVANRPPLTGSEPVTATVLLMDRLNTSGADQIWAYQRTIDYLGRAPLNEYIALFSMNLRLTQVHELSKDRESLLRAFQYAWAQPQGVDPLPEDKDAPLPPDTFMNLQRRRDIVAASFENLSVYLRGLPGRKKLVWIGSSLPLFSKMPTGTVIKTEQLLDMSPQLFAAARKLNDANTAVYPVNPTTPVDMADERINTMIRLADITGGKPYYGFSDTDRGIEEAVSDTEVTYTLGFYAPESKRYESHKLDVKVARGGVNVRYRRSYTPAVKSRPVSADRAQRTLDEWLHNPFDAIEIPIAAVARRVVNRPGNYAVEIAIDLGAVALEERNGRWRGTLDLAISPDVKGKVKGLHQVVELRLSQQQYVNALNDGFVVVNPYKATNDKGELIGPKLHVAILDRATGRAGSVRVPLDLPPTTR